MADFFLVRTASLFMLRTYGAQIHWHIISKKALFAPHRFLSNKSPIHFAGESGNRNTFLNGNWHVLKWKWTSIFTVPYLCPTTVKIFTHLISRYQLPLKGLSKRPGRVELGRVWEYWIIYGGPGFLAVVSWRDNAIPRVPSLSLRPNWLPLPPHPQAFPPLPTHTQSLAYRWGGGGSQYRRLDSVYSVWFGSLPALPQFFFANSFSFWVSPVDFTDGRWQGVSEEPNHRPRESLALSKSFITLWALVS
jgi:hypothetical protein